MGTNATLSEAPAGATGGEGRTGWPELAYLCSEYPAISHTFVLREVASLRRLGARVETFTIRRTDPAKLLCRADREAFDTTFAILPPRWSKLVRSHLKLAVRHPLAYLATLAAALRLAPPGLRGRLWQLFYFVEAVMLWDECRRRGIRHVHVHFANVSADVALLVARIGSATDPRHPWSWSFTMHGPTEFWDAARHRLAEKVRRARFVVCISDFARSQLMALTEPSQWGKLEVVRVGLPTERFEPEAASVASGPAQILCVGRLVPEKGQAVLLEAFARLRGRGVAARLTIAGDGPQRASLEDLAGRLGVRSDVRFAGAVGQDDLRDLYAEATLFCLPSFSEGVPVVLMEAMAMEVPVISAPIAGIPELIEAGRSGLLVAPGRVEELADALERLLLDESLRRQLGAEGRAKVLDRFDAAKTAPQLLELFSRHSL